MEETTNNSNRIFSIEGNIGSGKSTIVELLKDLKFNKEVVFLREPVDIWNTIKDKENNTILSKFYADANKYAFSFQIMAYISRLSLLRQAIKTHSNKIIITERCIETDKNVFAKMLYDDGKIEEINYKIYLQWFDEFVKDFPVTAFIQINTSPEKCYERVIQRNRNGETIPLDYLNKCQDYHDVWFNNTNANIITINNNIDSDNEKYQENLITIRDFINIFSNYNIPDIENTFND